MGPKAFITCYVCSREFGSRSIPFHEPKCLERWRSSNRTLPPEKRAPTPVKPVGWKESADSEWLCTNCRVSVPSAKRGEHAAICFAKSTHLAFKDKLHLTGNKTPVSPKKGKENKNSINNSSIDKADIEVNQQECKKECKPSSENTSDPPKEEVSNTSDKSIRPQTKILRRPTPNLKHPVIQVDSDESGGDSDRSKEDNPKKMTHSGSADASGDHKTKNFIMYNKYNVEKNTKNSPKDRAHYNKKDDISSVLNPSIPFPCNSCARSIAPERLHSHSKTDARGLMLKKDNSTEAKDTNNNKKPVKPKSGAPPVTIKRLEEPKPLPIQKPETNCPVPKKNGDASSNVCYICLKEPGSVTMSLHEKKCLERWKKANRLLSPSLRKPLPQKAIKQDQSKDQDPKLIDPKPVELEKPSSNPKTEDNEKPKELRAHPKQVSITHHQKPVLQPKVSLDPAWQAVQSQLVPCPSCGRTFFPERMPVHQRVCKSKVVSQGLYRTQSMRDQCLTPNPDEDSGERRTVYVPCYICGRSFGSWVIQMHESQCLRRWRRENEKLPEHLQKQEPHITQLVLSEVPIEDNPIEETVLVPTEDGAWESHLQQLVPCPRCGRTFFPDRLEVHGRSCKGQITKQHLRNKTTA